MRSVKKIALMAILAFATAIAISCSDDIEIEDNLHDTRDGNTYNTVVIGNQEWMAENLRYNATGSRCYDDYDCQKYGRLYNWTTASYICPSGWHLPSDEEWNALITAVGGLSMSATKLKTTSWDRGCTNDFGFSALPLPGSDASVWWSITQNGSYYASSWMIEYDADFVSRYDKEKTNLFSIRCVKDKNQSSSSSRPSSSSIQSSSSRPSSSSTQSSSSRPSSSSTQSSSSRPSSSSTQSSSSRPSSSSTQSSSSIQSSSSRPSSSSGLLQNGVYHETGNLPSGTTGNLSVVPSDVINPGGQNTFVVSSNGQLTKLYIKFGNDPGYYEVNVLPSYFTSSTGGIYKYNIPLQFTDISGYRYISFGSDILSPIMVIYLEDIYGTASIHGVVYKTVKINGLTWMTENLNYDDMEHSKCYGDETGGDRESKCDDYGRLYDWTTATAVCPADDGWRLPTNADWDNLYRYADRTIGTASPYYSLTAGWYLKSESGWNSTGNGTDAFGFKALPGGFGIGYPGGAIFQDNVICGYWWSATEYNASRAYGRNMCKDYDKADFSTYDKTRLLSVRCVK